MSIEKIPLRVQHKRMTANEWRSSSLILLDGEIGVESDTGYLKVGDGRSRFTNLKYLKGEKGDRGEKGQQGERGQPGRDGTNGSAGQNIINQQNKQPMKYWAGTEAQYNAIPVKDPYTIYDVFK
mgnify:FL=1|jgi:hypothetical protein